MSARRFEPSTALTFATVSGDKQRLLAFLDETPTKAWVFDLSQVKSCDSAGLALLLEAKRLSEKRNINCHFDGISDDIKSLIRFCGVNELLL